MSQYCSWVRSLQLLSLLKKQHWVCKVTGAWDVWPQSLGEPSGQAGRSAAFWTFQNSTSPPCSPKRSYHLHLIATWHAWEEARAHQFQPRCIRWLAVLRKISEARKDEGEFTDITWASVAWEGHHEPLALPSTARHAVIPRQAAAPQPDLFPWKTLAQFAQQQPLEDVETLSHQEAFGNAFAPFMLLDIATHHSFSYRCYTLHPRGVLRQSHHQSISNTAFNVFLSSWSTSQLPKNTVWRPNTCKWRKFPEGTTNGAVQKSRGISSAVTQGSITQAARQGLPQPWGRVERGTEPAPSSLPGLPLLGGARPCPCETQFKVDRNRQSFISSVPGLLSAVQLREPWGWREKKVFVVNYECVNFKK